MLQFPQWRNVFVEATQIFSTGCQDKLMLVVKGGQQLSYYRIAKIKSAESP